jgi:hypothetical protein
MSFTCGTHFGDTKLVASTTGNPEVASLLISSIFTGVGTVFFHFVVHLVAQLPQFLHS